MTDIDSILNRIRSGLSKHGRKMLISKETGIHVVKLSAVAKPDWNPTASTIRRLDAAVIQLGFASPDDAAKQLQDGPAPPAPVRADLEGDNHADD